MNNGYSYIAKTKSLPNPLKNTTSSVLHIVRNNYVRKKE
jgi:hypothetical protein